MRFADPLVPNPGSRTSGLGAMPVRSRFHRLVATLGVVMAIASLLGPVAARNVWAGPPQQVEQTSITGQFVDVPGPPPKRVWRETVTFRNNSGHALAGAIVTSQPYSGFKDFPGLVRDGKTAAMLEQKVDFAIGEEKKIVFDHEPLPGGKGYTAWYTDVYDTPAHRKNGIGPWVGVGNYALLEIPPDRGASAITDSFLFPYPDAIQRRGLGAVTYTLAITETDLPPDWAFAGLSDDSFLLDPLHEHFIGATFNVPTSLVPGQVALVEFDVKIGDETLGSTYLGIRVVPEPRVSMLTAVGLGALALQFGLSAALRRRTVQSG